jgi:thiamine-phosphate pyrophosphorylase
VYPILDTATLARVGLSAERAAEAVLEGGARLVQFRHKGFFSRDVFEAARRIASLARQAGATFVIDDRADISLLLEAGCHVGQEDLAPQDARRVLGPGLMLGFSTHNESQLIAGDREPVDYLALGPIFATGSKANPDPVVGVDEVRRLRKLTRKPLVGIGGISLRNAQSVWAAGCDSLAVIGDLLADGASPSAIRHRVEAWISAAAEVASPRG